MPELATSPFQTYQHTQCIHPALHNAKKLCDKDGFRLSGARKRALGLTCECLRALDAFAIQGQLPQGRVKLTVYRPLEVSGTGQDDREEAYAR